MPAGGEVTMFKQFFNWVDKDETTGPTQPYIIGRIAKVEREPFDASSLHDNNVMAAQHNMVDDGSGKVQVCSLATFMPRLHFVRCQGVDVTLVAVFRSGEWKEGAKCPWTRPPMDSSTGVTVTWCCTPTRMKTKRSTSSTPGERTESSCN